MHVVGWETGSERRWMSDRKLLRSCHEGVLTMRATHTYSRNSNGAARRIEFVGEKPDGVSRRQSNRINMNS